MVKKVILGVTGGIASYKAVELARLFMQSGAEVQVVMTDAAVKFVAPLTFQTITGQPVYMEMFARQSGEKVRHVELTDEADVLVVAPATANTIGKMACGIADNLLTTVYLAAQCPRVIVPSMNVNMYNHRAVQENLGRLRDDGCSVMEPDTGELACGVYGRGRMPEPHDIFKFVRAALAPKDFAGIKSLVTAGPTREPLDPVRFISNPSTGLMGYALARALSERGADVTLVSGPSSLNCPAGVKLVSVETAEDMYAAVLEHYHDCKLVIKAAAVSDYRPRQRALQKIKKHDVAPTLELEATPDILMELGRSKDDRILVGFAAETENAIGNAGIKLARKNLDLIVVNDLTEPGCGFAAATNRVAIIDRNGRVEEMTLMEKEQLADRILDRVTALLHG